MGKTRGLRVRKDVHNYKENSAASFSCVQLSRPEWEAGPALSPDGCEVSVFSSSGVACGELACPEPVEEVGSVVVAVGTTFALSVGRGDSFSPVFTFSFVVDVGEAGAVWSARPSPFTSPVATRTAEATASAERASPYASPYLPSANAFLALSRLPLAFAIMLPQRSKILDSSSVGGGSTIPRTTKTMVPAGTSPIATPASSI